MFLKKMLAGALAAVMAVGSLSVPSFAETYRSGDFEYEVLSNGTVNITSYLGYDSNVMIPSEIDGRKVTALGLDTGYSVCYGEEFWVVIPATVTKIDGWAFEGVRGFFVEEDNKNYSSFDGVLFNKDMTTLVKYPIFKDYTKYTVPSGVTAIGELAFMGAEKLTEVVLPDGLTTIENAAFWLSDIDAINLPDSLTHIGNQAFESSSFGITTEITIPANVTYIGRRAFNDIFYLTSIKVDEGNKNYKSVDGVLFDKNMTTLVHYPANKGKTKYTVPNGVTSIGDYAFGHNVFAPLREVVLPEGLTTIGAGAFEGCTTLANINFPNSLTAIGERAFSITAITGSITIPGGVKCISADAFSFCENLTSVIIMDGVTRIERDAFMSCSSLTDVQIPASVTTISEDNGNVFYGGSDYLIIYSYANSAAQAYADKYKIRFVPLSADVPNTEATTSSTPAATISSTPAATVSSTPAATTTSTPAATTTSKPTTTTPKPETSTTTPPPAESEITTDSPDAGDINESTNDKQSADTSAEGAAAAVGIAIVIVAVVGGAIAATVFIILKKRK